jgi:hypothetical protein
MAEVYAGDIRAGVPPLVREHQPAGQVTEQLRLLEIRIGWGVPVDLRTRRGPTSNSALSRRSGLWSGLTGAK